MKRYLLIGSLVFSTFALADLEHTRGQGETPSAEKLSLSRGCFSHIEEFGCGHPANDHEIFIGCLDENRKNLSTDCQSFFERLYGRRK